MAVFDFTKFKLYDAPLKTLNLSYLNACIEKSKSYGINRLLNPTAWKSNKVALFGARSGSVSGNVAAGIYDSAIGEHNAAQTYTAYGRALTSSTAAPAYIQQMNAIDSLTLGDWYILVEFGRVGDDYKKVFHGYHLYVNSIRQNGLFVESNIPAAGKHYYGNENGEFTNAYDNYYYIKSWTLYNRATGSTAARSVVSTLTKNSLKYAGNVFPGLPFVCSGIETIGLKKTSTYSGFLGLCPTMGNTQTSGQFTDGGYNWDNSAYPFASGYSLASGADTGSIFPWLAEWYAVQFKRTSAEHYSKIGQPVHHVSTLPNGCVDLAAYPVNAQWRTLNETALADATAFPVVKGNNFYMVDYWATDGRNVAICINYFLAFKSPQVLFDLMSDWGVQRITDDPVTAQIAEGTDEPTGGFVPDEGLPSVGLETNPVITGGGYPDNTSDEIGQPSANISALNFANTYALNVAEARDFIGWLMTDDYTKNITELFGEKISAISSMQIFPFDIVAHDSAHIWETPLTVANVESPYTVHAINAGYNHWVYGGSYTYTPYFGDYNDYTSTSFDLYVPYGGIISLTPQNVVGREISLYYSVNLISGSATAFVYSNGVLIASTGCQMGQNVPITFTNANQKQIATTLQTISFASSTASSLAHQGVSSGFAAAEGDYAEAIAGSALGLFDAGLNAVNFATQQRLGGQISMGHIGNVSGDTSLLAPQTPFLIIDRIRVAYLSAPDKIIGKPSTQQTNLSNYSGSGFVKVRFAELAIPCTSSELSEINALLRDGIYI